MNLGRKQRVSNGANDYATAAYFRGVFAKGMDELYQLSFLLTADHGKAEQCFVAGLEDAMKENHVFKEWARSWAKRTIIHNTIRELKPHPPAISLSLALPPNVAPLPGDQDSHFVVDAVVGLKDFERFVFVMSVLEHFSEHECSLLLGCSPRDVREGRVRAIRQLMHSRGTSLLAKINSEVGRELVS